LLWTNKEKQWVTKNLDKQLRMNQKE
jgi:hypothetical protein